MKIMFCLKRIAIQNRNENEENSIDANIFTYKDNNYRKLFDFNEKTLIAGIKYNDDFNLKKHIDNDNNDVTYLSIFLTPGNIKRRIIPHRIKILEICFENFNELANLSGVKNFFVGATCTDNYNTKKLYDLLRLSHLNEELPFLIKDMKVQHENLKPILRTYQSNAVKWMLHRETSSEYFNLNYVKIYNTSCEQMFYMDVINLDLLVEKPLDIRIPKGGILADEMGLGKTVEIISLVLLNPRKGMLFENLTHNSSVAEQDTDSDDEILLIKKRKLEKDHDYCCSSKTVSENPLNKQVKCSKRKEKKLLCICKSSHIVKRKKKLLECQKCGILQHEKCLTKFSFDPYQFNSKFYCPKCWETFPITTSKATVIVTPVSIIDQWNSEIQRHSPALNIFQYNGISNGWISPKNLAEYDIVLIDYNSLKKEINFNCNNISKCNLRKKKQYMTVSSPLLMIKWWRVCLDEAQMVESSISKASQMVQQLQSEHRWSVTGTPIQKSINDLRGILEFLKVDPFHEKQIWNTLIAQFINENTTSLMNVLSKIMWRNCKRYVDDELQIPDQIYKTHYIVLTDAEELFYKGQHSECAQSFSQGVEKLISVSSTISQINPKILKKVLEPLKKLRQTATTPVLCTKLKDNVVKKCLQPQELMQHLRSTNEIECKSELRTIVSNYNGLAALHIIRNNFKEAIAMYKNVLMLAEIHTGNISVDTLLQIHALYNLMWIHSNNIENVNKINEDVDLEDLNKKLIKLEWKYMDLYYKNLKDSLNNYQTVHESISGLINKGLIERTEQFIVGVLEEIELENLTHQLLHKFADENLRIISFNNVRGIEYYLCIWYEEIFSHRAKVLKEFEKLFKFIDLIKPNTEYTKDIDKFVKDVFHCHLYIVQETEEYNDFGKNLPEQKCQLCKTSMLLDEFECLIFNKVEHGNIVKDWNPSLQENLLKIIINFCKFKLEGFDIKNSVETTDLLENLKKEFKQMIKLWSEIEYVVKAFDELNMCKLRLQVSEEESDSKTLYKIPIYEVNSHFEQSNFQLKSAKVLLSRKLGRLKYLDYLENGKKDLDPCPICHLEPKSKYTVFECGHRLCMICLAELTKSDHRNIQCAICRNIQKVKDIYLVNVKNHDLDANEISVIGDHSTKIEKIVSTILKLRRDNNQVKVLIFSHWEPILEVIAKALEENCISHKLKWSTKSIKEFKDESLKITCLLLLLANGSKGLNLIDATHIILVEPILNPGEELQAIGRVHRIGQTNVTTVHRFIVKNTVEEKIFNATNGENSWEFSKISIDRIKELFSIEGSF